MEPRAVVLAGLGAIILWFGGQAMLDPPTRPFTTALAVAGAVLFLLVLVSRFDFRVPPPARPSSGRRARAGLAILAVSATLLIVAIALLPWAPHADFDIVGALWIMQNIVRVLVTVVLAAGVIVGFAWWRRG